MHLTEKNIHTIARLARLKVKDEEVESLRQDLENILDWVEHLSEIDTSNVAPMTSVNLIQMVQRQDKVTEGNIASEILANAPDQQYDMFAVPKVVE